MSGIRIEGDLKKLRKSVKNLSEVEMKGLSKVIGLDLRRSTAERFKTQTTPEGKKWAESKSASEDGRKVLTDTARLRNSIKMKASTKGVAIGTNTIYANTHQYGAKDRVISARGGGKLKFKVNGQWSSKSSVKINIPARPFLGISEDDMREIKLMTTEEEEEEG